MKQFGKYLSVTGVALGFALAAQSASAQDVPKPTVSAGYQFQRMSLTASCGNNCSESLAGGWYVDFGYGVYRNLSVVGQIDGSKKADAFGVTALDFSNVNYGAGIRYSEKVNPMVTPFAQVILGGSHVGVTGTCTSCNAFALDLDGGVMLPISGPWGVQAAVGYRRAFFSDTSDPGGGVNVFRFTAGVLYTLP